MNQKYINLRSSTVAASQEPDIITNGFDLRSKGCITPVRNQGNCNTCWAFAATALVESSICMTKELNPNKNKPEHISTQQLVDCFVKSDGTLGGCKSGGYSYEAIKYLIKGTHVAKDKCYKYEAKESTGHCLLDSLEDSCLMPVRTKLQRFRLHEFNNESAIIDHLSSYGPVSVAIDFESSLYLYGGGVLTDKRNIEQDGRHAMLIVGYGQYDGYKFWLVKNSWGDDWGYGGYMKIERGKNAFKIESRAYGLSFDYY